MKKRIISLFLALTLCVGMLPAPAWAEEPTDPTQAAGVVEPTNPSEETDPTTEPTEEETEPTEEETEPTEEETEPTEETTDPTEGLLDQTIPEEVAAYAASLPETISGTVTLDNYQGTETLKLDGETIQEKRSLPVCAVSPEALEKDTVVQRPLQFQRQRDQRLQPVADEDVR